MGLVWEAYDRFPCPWGSLVHHPKITTQIPGNTWDIPWFQMTNMHPISWSRTMIRDVFQSLFLGWGRKKIVYCYSEMISVWDQKSLIKIKFLLLLLLLSLLFGADRFEFVSPRRCEDRTWCPRLFLHCYRLRFKDMRWGVKLQMLNHELRGILLYTKQYNGMVETNLETPNSYLCSPGLLKPLGWTLILWWDSSAKANPWMVNVLSIFFEDASHLLYISSRGSR